MAWIWFLPAGVSLVALLTVLASLRALDAEAQRLQAEIAHVPELARQARDVKARAVQAEITRRATDDVLAGWARH
jgi:hypothetical protein